MNEVKIADAVLKAAEKVASIDLGQVERKARSLTANDLGTVTRKFVNAINPHCPERTEKRVQATLDIAYLLGNLGGWYSEKQEKRFEEIAANLGRKPSDVSPDAVGLNAKLAHLRSRVSEDDLLAALWIALGLADGEMPALYRKALVLLRGEFKHSALLYGALGGLPVYSAASAVGGLGMGIVTSIMGGLQGLRHQQTLDRYCPLVSDEFLSQAETLIGKMGELENLLVGMENAAEKEHIRQEYAAVSQQLQELIDPPSPGDNEEEGEE